MEDLLTVLGLFIVACILLTIAAVTFTLEVFIFFVSLLIRLIKQRRNEKL